MDTVLCRQFPSVAQSKIKCPDQPPLWPWAEWAPGFQGCFHTETVQCEDSVQLSYCAWYGIRRVERRVSVCYRHCKHFYSAIRLPVRLYQAVSSSIAVNSGPRSAGIRPDQPPPAWANGCLAIHARIKTCRPDGLVQILELTCSMTLYSHLMYRNICAKSLSTVHISSFCSSASSFFFTEVLSSFQALQAWDFLMVITASELLINIYATNFGHWQWLASFLSSRCL